MAATKYRLFGVGLKGKSPVVSSQHRINCYIERVVDEETEQTSIIGSAGLDDFADLGAFPSRGRVEVDNLLYVVNRNTFWEINNAGDRTSRGTIGTTAGRVDMFYDGDDKVVILDGEKGYSYTISTTTLAEISDSDFPDAATTGDFQDIYYLVFGPGDTFQLTDDVTAWDALDIANANVGTIVRGIADHGEVVIFGQKKVSFWVNTGGQDFPYQPIKGAEKEVGLAARWSLTKFDDSLAFLGRNSLGQVQVYKMQGHSPVLISNPELDSIINSYATVGDATGFAYIDRGHPFYRLNFPSAGKSWEYDGLSGTWQERQSGTSGLRSRGEMAVDFLNKVRIFDYANGMIYTLNAETYDESGEQFPFEITSRRVVSNYEPFSINQVYLDFETGVGLATGQGSDPQVMLTCSRNGGQTWGNEVWKPLGAIGKYETRVDWDQFGTSETFIFRVRITDPVRRHLMNAAAIRAG